MNLKFFCVALLCAMAQLVSSSIWAEEAQRSAQTQSVSASNDTIQRFVKAEFAERRAMLNQWPGTIEEFDRLVALIDSDELYRDSAGTTYILKNNEKLLRYPDEQVIETWPGDLSQVTLVNTLRKALNFGQAQAKLKSEESAQRLAAIDILENNLSELNVAQINQLYLHEQNNKVKQRLAQLKARLDFESPDVLVQIQAAKVLTDSNRPEVLALVEQALTQSNLNPELKAVLVDAKSQIKTRIQASEWAGHVFSGFSTASILLLAALGLAITYGLLGVINMAHGE
jgi:urea transport system permease protein